MPTADTINPDNNADVNRMNIKKKQQIHVRHFVLLFVIIESNNIRNFEALMIILILCSRICFVWPIEQNNDDDVLLFIFQFHCIIRMKMMLLFSFSLSFPNNTRVRTIHCCCFGMDPGL